jgi:biopolymer transport protein ExbB
MWYNASWNNRIKITQDHTKVPSTQTDIPVYVDLYGMPTAFFSHVLSTGADIRVTTSDGTTEVAIQVVAIDTGAKTGQLWFKAPSLSSTVNTDFYIYYGNPSASAYATTDPYGRNAVWSNGYQNVYHLEVGNSSDSSGNFSDATDNSSSSQTGKIGLGRGFPGSAYINTGDISNSNWTNVTVEAWIYLTGTVTYNGVFYKGTTDIGRFLINGSNGQILVQTQNGNMLSATGVVPLNTLVKVEYVYNQTAGYEYVYMNATQVASKARTGNITQNSTNLFIGAGFSNTGTYPFNGNIDEFRISTVARTDNWRTTSYNNENSPSTFYSVGSEESNISLRIFMS